MVQDLRELPLAEFGRGGDVHDLFDLNRVSQTLRAHPVVGLDQVGRALFRCVVTLRNGMALALKRVDQENYLQLDRKILGANG